LTAGLGVDDRSSQGSRRRESLAAEYLWTGSERLRAAAGLRIENVSDDGREVGFAPYFVVSGPNTQHTFLLQIEYQTQPAGDLLVIDLSLLF